jgi:hypothetical protein
MFLFKCLFLVEVLTTNEELMLYLLKLVSLLRDVDFGFLIESSRCILIKPKSQSFPASFLTALQKGTVHFYG